MEEEEEEEEGREAPGHSARHLTGHIRLAVPGTSLLVRDAAVCKRSSAVRRRTRTQVREALSGGECRECHD